MDIKDTHLSQGFSSKVHPYTRHAKTQKKAARLLCRRIYEYRDKVPSGPWLDIGSGPAIMAQYLNSEHIYNLDTAQASLEYAQHVSPGQNIRGSMDTLPFRQKSFSLIMSSTALHWARSPKETIQNAVSLLKRNGVLAINILDSHTLLPLRRAQQRYNIPSPATYLTREELRHTTDSLPCRILSYGTHTYTEEFDTPKHALQAISRIGATGHFGKRLSPGKLTRFIREYGALQKSGTIKNTYSYITILLQNE
ncbi:MAG: methyltransferase domain-containing protein [Fibrobacterota bacterium]